MRNSVGFYCYLELLGKEDLEDFMTESSPKLCPEQDLKLNLPHVGRPVPI